MELKKIVTAVSFALIAVSSSQTFAATQGEAETRNIQLLTEELNKDSQRTINKIIEIAPDGDVNSRYLGMKFNDLNKQAFMYSHLIKSRELLKIDLEVASFESKKERVNQLIEILANSTATSAFNEFIKTVKMPQAQGKHVELHQKFIEEHSIYDFKSAKGEHEFLDYLVKHGSDFKVFTPLNIATDLKLRIDKYREPADVRDLAYDEELEKQNIIFDINALALTHSNSVGSDNNYSGSTDSSTKHAVEIAKWVDDIIFDAPLVGPLKAELDNLELQKQINKSDEKRDNFYKDLAQRIDEF